ncbi:immunity protein BlpZ [Streptococcus pneumoniae]|nr:immunity protein BlpZ [Streptococcus pneumoniae]
MYKHLFFLDSKTLDRLTPYILVLASDTIIHPKSKNHPESLP